LVSLPSLRGGFLFVEGYSGTMRDIPSAIQAKSEPEYRGLCAPPFDPAKGSEGSRVFC